MGWNETVILWLLKSGSQYNNLFKDHQMHKGLQRKVQREGGEDTGGVIQMLKTLLVLGCVPRRRKPNCGYEEIKAAIRRNL